MNVIIYLSGGLGNQLFQFSYGEYIRANYKCNVSFDISYYRDRGFRRFSLPDIGITVPIVSPIRSKILFEIDNSRRYRYLRNVAGALSCGKYVTMHEKTGVDVTEGPRSREVMLVGYWQDVEYAVYAKAKLLNAIDICCSLGNLVPEPACAVHIRRGDYLSKKVRGKMSILDVDYYMGAINYLRSKNGPVPVVIFSDDRKYACEFAKTIDNAVVFQGGAAGSDVSEFMMMKKFSLHVISNSTFSWWAAFLANNGEGSVVMPGRWRVDGVDAVRRLFCNGWKVLE